MAACTGRQKTINRLVVRIKNFILTVSTDSNCADVQFEIVVCSPGDTVLAPEATRAARPGTVSDLAILFVDPYQRLVT